MPNNQNRNNQDFSRFDSMTNEELEEILRLDVQKTEGEESDLEMLLYVMEVLAVRRKNSENPRKDAGEAFETFKEHYMPDDLSDDAEQVSLKPQVINMKPTKHLRPWLSRLVATAAILALVLVSSVTVHAMGIDIWNIIVTWTQETFQLGNTGQNESNIPDTDDKRIYATLQEALEHKSITTPLAPNWIPEEYNLVDIRVDETPMQLVFVAFYQCKDSKIKIQVKLYLDSDPQQIEQSDSLVETYESEGIIYYIFSDYNQLRAVWIRENYECYISGELTPEEIKAMIDSIEKG